ncbi:histidinol-phosphatase HisJ [Alkalihalobacillus sp. MEB203]|uniref:Histidinol-phosphatase n=1 Tax=Alkalihalobacterium chitinilyticum TaxID=2980103 RepID=A0ABT5VKC5_9BACI|nr:histidinol-phosphatase HisJ [Alkalihalobacterium chitinilyticum]MDE5415894.1 histidinol-phosphatase HisJ [Alkalihalobacterium chitinilyticum]
MIHDGHVHTPFCPHGSKDRLGSYIEKAIQLNIKGITFTEHAPLPLDFVDPVPEKDSAMTWDNLTSYIQEIQQLKEKYNRELTILLGLEVDFIEGYEEQTRKILDEAGPYLDDAILSVHFLKHNNSYFCLDYSPEMFEMMIGVFGSVDAIYDSYFKTVQQSIDANLGAYKPKRIGHISLVRKFQQKFPPTRNYDAAFHQLLDSIKEKGLALDYNGAGVVKPLCGEPYPPESVIKSALERKIPLIYGSDAHSVKGLSQGIEKLYTGATFSVPECLS